MSNVHDLFGSKKGEDDDNDDENNRFVGGIGERGGGSGLAVQPNRDDADGGSGGGERDSLFRLAQNATSEDSAQVRRTITMYRDGFVVDDGPYRRLDDPNNADFLRSLAAGRTPRELIEESGEGDVVVGLVDKRSEDYKEEFRSFSGQGTSLGTSNAGGGASDSGGGGGVFDPASLPDAPAAADGNSTTSVQVRLPDGRRRVIRIGLSSTVADLAAHLRGDAPDSAPFRMVSGFPPRPLTDPSATVEQAGLKGAQVSLQKAG